MTKSDEDDMRNILEENNILRGKEFSIELRLREDLGIYGEDSEDFFGKFKEKFQTDLSELDLTKFFPPELDYFWTFKKIFPFLDKKEYIPININHLIAVRKRGYWFDPK